MLVVALTSTACDKKHDADITGISDCLRARDARVVSQPPGFEKAARRRGWTIRRFRMSARNAVTVLKARSESGARDAHTRVTEAIAAVDNSRPTAQRRGRIVYWWDEAPTAAQRRVFNRCVD
jgi:hypothetical protein